MVEGQVEPAYHVMLMPIIDNPEIQRLVVESRALSASLSLVEGQTPTSRAEALSLVREALVAFKSDGSVEDVISQAAMRHILGEPILETDIQITDHPLDRHIFEVAARAWLAWLTGRDRENAHGDLSSLVVPGSLPEGGALSLMALQPWTEAVARLLEGDIREARRLFRRATDLTSQLGSEFNSAIQWTYAASFLTWEGTPSGSKG